MAGKYRVNARPASNQIRNWGVPGATALLIPYGEGECAGFLRSPSGGDLGEFGTWGSVAGLTKVPAVHRWRRLIARAKRLTWLCGLSAFLCSGDWHVFLGMAQLLAFESALVTIPAALWGYWLQKQQNSACPALVRNSVTMRRYDATAERVGVLPGQDR